ncbi:MAG: tRNA (adenosine(37)-N6)-dimethylallyltransferase MiaA [Bacteroidota bacterium]
MHKPSFLLVVAGPTASGKTAVSVALAKHFQTVVLSADSRQFYREMNIGTAKPRPTEQQGIPHYFIDSLSIHDPYTVGDYERDALELLEELFQKHSLVILTGGSGLFIKALCEGLDEFPEVPEGVRQALEQQLEEKGIESLQAELLQTDPSYYQVVDRQNPVRLIRALSVIRASGQAFSSFRTQSRKSRPFQILYTSLEQDRDLLYERIDRRVDQMMKEGLAKEARELYPLRHLNALQTVGYQEFFDHFDGFYDLVGAVERIKRNSRRYAKRQLTWLRKQDQWTRFAKEDIAGMIQWVEEQRKRR